MPNAIVLKHFVPALDGTPQNYALLAHRWSCTQQSLRRRHRWRRWLINLWMVVAHPCPDAGYWSEVLFCIIPTYMNDLVIKVTDCDFFFYLITKTCLYNIDPLKPHFYIVKLGFTGVYIIFLISAQNIDCGYPLEPPRRSGSNEYPQSMF